jgi:HEAT repeat protein
LTSDVDSDVRDWATFNLGTQSRLDTPAIRAALWARVDDSDDEVRGEALCGLAEKGDRGVVDAVIRELFDERGSPLAVDAAEALPDPRLLPALLHLRANHTGVIHGLDDAIAACGGSAGDAGENPTSE